MRDRAPFDGALASLVARLGVTFRDPELLELALTHRSYASEHEVDGTNERLEFLGDAILNLCVTDMLFKRFPDYGEGDLAKLRASLVSEPTLAEVALELDISEEVKLGRGERLSGGASKPSILGDTMEALIGAVYLDRGVQAARGVVKRLFGARIDDAVGSPVPKDAKTRLQELVTREHGVLPRYRTVGSGPDHQKRFQAEVFVGQSLIGTGSGRSKKDAEQCAADDALGHIPAVQSEAAGA